MSAFEIKAMCFQITKHLLDSLWNSQATCLR